MRFICVAGGLLVGMPEEVPRSAMLSEADLQYYVSCYKKSGFRLAVARSLNSAVFFLTVIINFHSKIFKSDVCVWELLRWYLNKVV